MSAFDDYCIVCEKVCENGSAYCSDSCKNLDQEHSNSPTLSVCSGLPSISGSFSLHNSHSQSHSNSISMPNSSTGTTTTTTTTMLSPLLTPQINPRCSIVGSIKSPTLKDLTYESPLLSTSAHQSNILNDLDSNRLDLNNSMVPSSSISERLSKSINNKNNNQGITDVSNLLNSSSENYKKWLSIH